MKLMRAAKKLILIVVMLSMMGMQPIASAETKEQSESYGA